MYTVIESKKSKLQMTRLAVLISLFPMLALAGCCEPIVIRPEAGLTAPLETYQLIEGDTVRDLATKYELRGLSIDEANKRFEKLRGE